MSINLSFDTGNLAKEEAAGLSALIAAVQPVLPTFAELQKRYDGFYGQTGTAVPTAPIAERLVAAVGEEKAAELVVSNKSDSELAAIADGQPTRKRGEPSPGKARRTKAEIAEDEAAEASEQANIRSGAEDRVDPENPPAEDDEATAQQDAADEQAEAESAELTIDDVKAVVNDYVAAYGMPAVQEDGPAIFKEALGNPPDGEKFWKFSILPTDQASLKKLASVWRRAVDENPLKREKV